MTTILTDSQHYTDIASAIRSKAGVQDLFKPSEMASAIAAIPTGGGASLGSKSISANGTYYAQADNLDGYSQVTVNVSGGGGGGDEDAIIARTISNLVNDTASVVGAFAFYSAQALQSVSMGAVVSIGQYAFCSCSNLTTIYFPNCVSVAIYGFDRCTNLTEVAMSLCTHVDDYAFHSCVALGAVSLPLCTSAKTYAFEGCSNLTSVHMPECSYLGGSAFRDCSKLARIELPKCASILESAFATCFSLQEVILPKCSYIGKSAFASCYNLISLNLAGVSSVPSLVSFAVFWSTPLYNNSASAGQWGSIYVPSSLYSDFLSAKNWSHSMITPRIVSV